MEKEFGYAEAVSLKTVKNWLANFRRLEHKPELELCNDPFEWHHIGHHGIPWEASALITEMMVMPTPWPVSHRPSIQEVLWWWRIRLAAPSLGLVTVAHLAVGCMFRELVGLLHDRPPRLDDVYWYLAFRPWESDEKQELYQAALNAQKVPKLIIQWHWKLGQQFIREDVEDLDFGLSIENREPDLTWEEIIIPKP